jgi:hypothetical protein
MDDSKCTGTREEVLGKLRRCYQKPGRVHRKKLIDKAAELLSRNDSVGREVIAKQMLAQAEK